MVQEMHDKLEDMVNLVKSSGDKTERGPGAVTRPEQKAEFDQLRQKFHKVCSYTLVFHRDYV